MGRQPNREQAGTSVARKSSSSLTSEYKDIDIDPINSTTLETRCLPRAPPDPNLDGYCGKYHALNTTPTISRDITSQGLLQVIFNAIPASRQSLQWYKPDCFSWFPLQRDDWLLRRMIDWDFWREGVFEFVRAEKEATEVSALLWQWDEGEAATVFKRI